VTEALPARIFKGDREDHEGSEIYGFELRALRAFLRGDSPDSSVFEHLFGLFNCDVLNKRP
jgi:hypothetical protein